MTHVELPSDIFQALKLLLDKNQLASAYKENGTLDMTGIVLEESKTNSTVDLILSLIQNDPHQFSSRPCATCQTITSLAGKPFGCNLKAVTK